MAVSSDMTETGSPLSRFCRYAPLGTGASGSGHTELVCCVTDPANSVHTRRATGWRRRVPALFMRIATAQAGLALWIRALGVSIMNSSILDCRPLVSAVKQYGHS